MPASITMDTDSQEQALRKLLTIAFLAVLLAGAGWYYVGAARKMAATRFKTTTQDLSLTVPITSSTVTVSSKHFSLFPITIPDGAVNSSVDLKFTVNGPGLAEALIVDDQGLADWKRTGVTRTIYRSGLMSHASAKVSLTPKITRAFLVVNNPTFASENITVSASLSHTPGR